MWGFSVAELPTVTISLPCYNSEATLADALRSIWAQTFGDWELIAIDDGSADATPDILRSVAAADSRVIVVADGRNAGRAARLNQAATLARGQYLARMDADDLMFPRRLARQVEFLEANADVDLLGAGVVSIDLATRPRGVRFAPARVRSPFRILAGEVLYHPVVTGRAAWFQENPYLEDYLYSDDFALWAKAASHLRIANLLEPLLFYREHGLFTHVKFRGRIAETRRALRRYGPPAVGRLLTMVLLLRRSCKDGVYELLHHLGLWRLSLYLSNRGITRRTGADYAGELATIRATEVPGIVSGTTA